jgi:hypothetical protein
MQHAEEAEIILAFSFAAGVLSTTGIRKWC